MHKKPFVCFVRNLANQCIAFTGSIKGILDDFFCFQTLINKYNLQYISKINTQLSELATPNVTSVHDFEFIKKSTLTVLSFNQDSDSRRTNDGDIIENASTRKLLIGTLTDVIQSVIMAKIS